MFLCNKVGHVQQNIIQMCTKKGCLKDSACCKKCLKEFHSDHQIIEFEYLDEFMENNWISPKINNLLKILEETQELIALYHQTLKEMLLKSDGYRMHQQQPSLTILNHLGLMNKCKPIIEQTIKKLENQFQSSKFQIEEQYYKMVKQLMNCGFTSTIDLNEIKQKNIQGHVLFMKGNWKGALNHYEQDKIQHSIRHQINQALCLSKIGNKQKSIEIINELDSKYPQIKKIQFQKGILAINSNQRKDSLNLVRNNIMKNKEISHLACKMGLILEEAQEYNKAIQYYNQAIQQYPENGKIYIKKCIQ